jgi:hypothetical protein
MCAEGGEERITSALHIHLHVEKQTEEGKHIKELRPFYIRVEVSPCTRLQKLN